MKLSDAYYCAKVRNRIQNLNLGGSCKILCNSGHYSKLHNIFTVKVISNIPLWVWLCFWYLSSIFEKLNKLCYYLSIQIMLLNQLWISNYVGQLISCGSWFQFKTKYDYPKASLLVLSWYCSWIQLFLETLSKES